MSEQVYDIPLDDSGYSEPFTVEDFIREAEQEFHWDIESRILLYWLLLKREAEPIKTRIRKINVAFEDEYGDFRRSERQEYNFNNR